MPIETEIQLEEASPMAARQIRCVVIELRNPAEFTENNAAQNAAQGSHEVAREDAIRAAFGTTMGEDLLPWADPYIASLLAHCQAEHTEVDEQTGETMVPEIECDHLVLPADVIADLFAHEAMRMHAEQHEEFEVSAEEAALEQIALDADAFDAEVMRMSEEFCNEWEDEDWDAEAFGWHDFEAPRHAK